MKNSEINKFQKVLITLAKTREPVELLVLKGKKHLTKKEIEERKNSEIKAKKDKIFAPKYLTKKLQEEFNEIAEELVEVGIFSNLDVDTLARFLVAKDMYIKLSKKLRTLDCLSDEYTKCLINQDKLFKQCRQCSADLGLNISSRCKLVVPKPEEKKVNKFSNLGGNNG